MKATSTEKIIVYTVLIVLALWALFPFYWAFVNSIKVPSQIFAKSWIPIVQFKPTLHNWQVELKTPLVLKAMKNSTIVAVVSTLVALILGTMVGFALSVFNYRGAFKNVDIYIFFLTQRILAPAVVLIPLYIIMKNLHLLDTVWALIIVNITFNIPMAVVIMREMFKSIPKEIMEAALVDGASWGKIFSNVAIPLAAPGLVATSMIIFSYVWNEFLFALSFSFTKAATLPVIVAGTQQNRGIEFWYVGTRALLVMILPVIFSLLVQRYLVKGLTFGAVKE